MNKTRLSFLFTKRSSLFFYEQVWGRPIGKPSIYKSSSSYQIIMSTNLLQIRLQKATGRRTMTTRPRWRNPPGICRRPKMAGETEATVVSEVTAASALVAMTGVWGVSEIGDIGRIEIVVIEVQDMTEIEGKLQVFLQSWCICRYLLTWRDWIRLLIHWWSKTVVFRFLFIYLFFKNLMSWKLWLMIC